MNEYIKQISDRIRELRDILDLTAEEVAQQIGVSTEEYLAYENGEKEIPISLLYKVASVFKVDPTVLMTGDVPRMDDYTVVRGGNGIKVERYPGYSFSALAFNYKNRQMDPMIARRPGVQLCHRRRDQGSRRRQRIYIRGRRFHLLQS